MRVKNQQETCVLIGAGFSARAMIPHLLARGMSVYATTRTQAKADVLTALGATPIIYESGNVKTLSACLRRATHIISSVTPAKTDDPVLADLPMGLTSAAPHLKWAGYLSATSVYGDRQGQWAFEDELLYPLTQRGRQRVEAELEWLETGAPVHIFRLAGIYGPGRSPFAKIISGDARAVVKKGHIVNRIHVEDICSAVLASMDKPDPAQVYNIADGHPAPPQDVLAFAADIIGAQRPVRIGHDDAKLSDMARSFYIETKAINIDRAKRNLAWSPKYSTYKDGLAAIAKAERVAAQGVSVTGYIDIPEAQAKSVQAALPEHIRLSQDESGCLIFQITQDADKPNRYHLYERFTGPEAFKAHQARASASPWANVSQTASRHYDVYGL